MSACIIRADCPIDNFFYKSNFQPQSRIAQCLASAQPPKSPFERRRRLLTLPDHRKLEVKHD